jgi:hypothetical protein
MPSAMLGECVSRPAMIAAKTMTAAQATRAATVTDSPWPIDGMLAQWAQRRRCPSGQQIRHTVSRRQPWGGAGCDDDRAQQGDLG